MAESADATDLKSVGGDTVRVRPPLAPLPQYVIASLREATPHTTGDCFAPRKAGRSQ